MLLVYPSGAKNKWSFSSTIKIPANSFKVLSRVYIHNELWNYEINVLLFILDFIPFWYYVKYNYVLEI